MFKRGRILRDTNAGDGLLAVEGRQIAFSLETNWTSDEPPRVGAYVDVMLNDDGTLASVVFVDEKTLAKEQASKVLDQVATMGKAGASTLLEKVGFHTLGAVAVLAVAWYFLSTVSVQVSGSYAPSATFYEVLKLINSRNNDISSIGNLSRANAGLYGFVMWAVLLAPIVAHFVKSKWSTFAYFAPLAYTATIGATVYFGVRSSIGQAAGFASSFAGSDPQVQNQINQMVSQAISMAFQAISLGLGFYIGLAVSVYLAYVGFKAYKLN